MNLLGDKSKFNFSGSLPAVGLLVYFLILAAGYIVLDPFYSKIKGQYTQIDSLKEELALQEAELEGLKELKSSFPDFPEKLDMLDQVSLPKGGSEQFLAQLEKIANNNKVSLNSFSPSISEGQGLGASVSITGSYANFNNFLEEIEKNRLVINISSLSISGQGNNMGFSLTLSQGI